MSGKLIGPAFAMGIVVLAIAFVIPTLIAAPHSDTSYTTQLEENATQDIGDVLEVSVDEISGQNVTVTLTDRDTRESAQTVLEESETENITLSGGEIIVAIESVDETEATVLVRYPATYGWSDPAVAFAENFGIILVALAFAMVVALAMVVMK